MKRDPNWGTPKDVVERIRLCLGGTISLDPFGSEISNRVVQADRIWTKEDNAFVQPWKAKTALINPPGGMVRQAWVKTCDELKNGNLKSAIWVGFSVEQLCLLSDPNGPEETNTARISGRGAFVPTDFSVCLRRKRISFVKETGETGSPTHSNYFVGLNVDPLRFERFFRSQGQVFHGLIASDRTLLEDTPCP